MPPSTEQLNNRKSWPYPALLPYSLKAYPIVQLAPAIGPQTPGQWPKPIDPKVDQWRQDTMDLGNIGSQIYIHVPFCPHLCSFCPLYKVKRKKDRTDHKKERFVQAMIREVELYGASPVVAGQVFNTIYIGGGTGSELSPEQLGRIINAIRRNLTVTADAEITLEGVAKQMAAPEYMAKSVDYGANRISFGVESLEPKLRKEIGRGDSIEAYLRLIEISRGLSPDMMINAETMAAMPGQTLESVEFDVKEMIRWGLDSADVFYYVMMPGTKLEQLVSLGKREEPKYGASMLQVRDRVLSLFNEAGYDAVTGEVFSKSDRDLFTHTSFGGGGNALNWVLALGPSGFGQVNGTVYQNVCDLNQYLYDLDAGMFPIGTAERLDVNTARRRAAMLSLLRLEVPDALFKTEADARRIDKWRRLGLMRPVTGGYKLTHRGTLWYNHMQMELLPLSYLVKAAGSMFGAVESQKGADEESSDTQAHELVEMFRAQGRLSSVAYKGFQWARKLPMFDSRPVGFTGTIET